MNRYTVRVCVCVCVCVCVRAVISEWFFFSPTSFKFDILNATHSDIPVAT